MSNDLIERFLRNNLDDDDYKEYSAALDELCTPKRQPLTDEDIDGCWDKNLWKEKEPHRVFARRVEAKINGIKENT